MLGRGIDNSMQFLTAQVWDALIIGVMMVGIALAFVRIYGDMTRPLRRSRSEMPDVQPPDHLE